MAHEWELAVACGAGWEAACELRVNSDGMHGAAPFHQLHLGCGAHATEE